MLRVGDMAPDFTITLGSGERFSLSEQRGMNVVLYFYPRAFTHGCSVQTRKFAEAYEEFREQDAIVVGVSTDGVDRLSRFGEACHAPFGLGSDESGQIRRLYDVQRHLGLGTSRVTYVISGDGVIRSVHHDEIVMASHVRKALDTLRSMQPLDTGVATGRRSEN